MHASDIGRAVTILGTNLNDYLSKLKMRETCSNIVLYIRNTILTDKCWFSTCVPPSNWFEQ